MTETINHQYRRLKQDPQSAVYARSVCRPTHVRWRCISWNGHFTETRDSEWQWHQLGHMQVCTSLHTDNHTSTPPFSFLQAAIFVIFQDGGRRYL